MKINFFLLAGLLLFQSIHSFCQQPPQEFYAGMDLVKTDQQEAKKYFLLAIQKDSSFHGSYHFLGVIYLNQHRPDSAIACFKKALELNKLNINHTKELDYVRLIAVYTYQQDFPDAFDIGWAALKLYPDNKSIASALREVCLWSFYINHDHLNPDYLSTEVRTDYVVTSIAQEYLILRHLNVKGEYLLMNSQALVQKNGASYDVFKCTLSESKKEVEVDFKIDWDMGKYFSGKTVPTQEVIDNTKNPVYEKAGTTLVADAKTDLQAAITKMLQ